MKADKATQPKNSAFEEKQAARELLGQVPSTLDHLDLDHVPPPMPRSAPEPQKSNGQLAPPKKCRPSNYTYVTVEKIMKGILIGLPPESAARNAGVAPSEVYRWMDLYDDVRECVTDGRAKLEEALAKTALGGTAKNPLLALHYLERRYAANWAPNTQAL